MPPLTLTFYTRQNCPLCDKAKAAIRASGIDVVLVEVDIDKDPDLRRRYGHDIPVVTYEGTELFRHVADLGRLEEIARSSRPTVTELSKEHCVPCRGGVPPLGGEELRALERELGGGWFVVDDHHLEKEFLFPDFAGALSFTNRVGAVAEQEGHHPDIHLAWGKVTITTWTHKIDGLTRSDFVLAAKIDAL